MEENSRLREENHQLRASGGREGAKSETNGMKEIISEMSKMQASMRAMEDRLTGAFAEGQPTAAAQMLASLPAPRRSALQQLLPNAPGRSTPPTFCVFIDGPDPDNFICVLSAFQLLAKPTGTTLHIILTGRPVNLHANLLTEEQRKEKMAAGVKFTDLLRAKEEDESHYEHSQAVLNDMLVRLEAFLCGVGIDRKRFVLYDGEIAPTAYVSHQMHAREFLFDRADLAKELFGGEEDDYVSGNSYKVMSADTYYQILEMLDAMPEDEKVHRPPSQSALSTHSRSFSLGKLPHRSCLAEAKDPLSGH
jgi:hypothetical protein